MRITSRAGFTLTELIVSLTLLGFILAAVFTTVLRSQQDVARQQNVVNAQNSVRDAEQVIVSVLRTAGADPLKSKLTLLDPNPLGSAVYDNFRAVSDFNPADDDVLDPLEDVQVHVANDTLFVRCQAGQAAQPLAYPVESLRFEYYLSSGVVATTTAQLALATRVKVTIVVPHSPHNNTLERRETWVYLRNRR